MPCGAIVRLKREDLLPQLVALLEEPDPRAPVVQEVGTKQVLVVNEMVRINHHHWLCPVSLPGTNGDVSSRRSPQVCHCPTSRSPAGPSGGFTASRVQRRWCGSM